MKTKAMTCFICGDKFFHQTYIEPAEPCDCGGCWRRDDFDGPDDPRFHEAMARWKRRQAGEDDIDEAEA